MHQQLGVGTGSQAGHDKCEIQLLEGENTPLLDRTLPWVRLPHGGLRLEHWNCYEERNKERKGAYNHVTGSSERICSVSMVVIRA